MVGEQDQGAADDFGAGWRAAPGASQPLVYRAGAAPAGDGVGEGIE